MALESPNQQMLPAATLVESLVALSLITVAFAICTLIFQQLITQHPPMQQFRARQTLSNEILLLEQGKLSAGFEQSEITRIPSKQFQELEEVHLILKDEKGQIVRTQKWLVDEQE